MVSSKQSRLEQAIMRQAKYNALNIDEKINLAKSRGGSVKELSKLMAKKENLNKKKE
jgi:hypothetical protein